MSWWEYVQRTAQGQSPGQIAVAMADGTAVSTVARWRNSTPKRERVIAFAKAYGRPETEALLAANLSSDSADAESMLGAVSNKALVAEVLRRMEH